LKAFNLTSPRRINISPITLKLSLRSTIVLATLSSQAPRALYGLVANLPKIRASNGPDHSKVKFSKRKPVFSMRFLVVGVLFHSQYLRDAADKAIYQDLSGEELWTMEGLQIPVYHTENGG
jgi:hypothetical protein